jgi:hypothetical protein
VPVTAVMQAAKNAFTKASPQLLVGVRLSEGRAALVFTQQLRQLGGIGHNAPRLIAAEQLGCRAGRWRDR